MAESGVFDKVTNWMMTQENHTEEYAKESQRQFLMFASLFKQVENPTSTKALIPSEAADEYWHNFLLFSREYDQWCKEYFGKKLHHYPKAGCPEFWQSTQRLVHTKYGESWDQAGSSAGSILDEFFGEYSYDERIW